jgi:hypothetical protein
MNKAKAFSFEISTDKVHVVGQFFGQKLCQASFPSKPLSTLTQLFHNPCKHLSTKEREFVFQ